MPYISDKTTREFMNQISKNIIDVVLWKGLRGNLNYLLFKTAKDMCTNYTAYADFLSELAEASAEIRRRLLAKYEDEKIETNGDVE